MFQPPNPSKLPAILQRNRHARAGTAALVLLVVVALAAACSSSGSSGNSSSGQTLKIITWVNPPAVKALQQIDAEFEKANPGVKVDLGTAENVNGPYKTMLQQTVDASSADIVTNVTQLQPLPLKVTSTNVTYWQTYTMHGVFAPLNGQPFLKDYKSGALAAETYQGKTYGVVSGEYQEGVFYNKKIFAQYHLSAPTTYTQFLTLLNTLKSHGVTPMWLGLGAVGPVYLQFLYYHLIDSVWQPRRFGHLATGPETRAGLPGRGMAGHAGRIRRRQGRDAAGRVVGPGLGPGRQQVDPGRLLPAAGEQHRGQQQERAAERPHVLGAQRLTAQGPGDEVAGLLLEVKHLQAVRGHHRHLLQPEQRNVQQLLLPGAGELVRQGRLLHQLLPGAVRHRQLLGPAGQLADAAAGRDLGPEEACPGRAVVPERLVDVVTAAGRRP